MKHSMTSAEMCRKFGWKAGDLIQGDEGYGPTVIRLTAIGEAGVLARMISQNGKPVDRGESYWTLEHRGWKLVAARD